MFSPRVPTRKVTISLPDELVAFADREADRMEMSRSAMIARVLRRAKAEIEEALAAEGYGYYAEESREFSEASAGSVAEALGHDGWARGDLLR